MPRNRKPRSTPSQQEIKEWLVARQQMSLNHILTFVHKYDNALITKDEMVEGIKKEVERHTNTIYDTGFEDGVAQSVDAEDEDNPISFEIEEDDDDEGTTVAG